MNRNKIILASLAMFLIALAAIPIVTAQSPYPSAGQLGFQANIESSGKCRLNTGSIYGSTYGHTELFVGNYIMEGEGQLCYQIIRCIDVIAASDPSTPLVPCLDCGYKSDGSPRAMLDRSVSSIIVVMSVNPIACHQAGAGLVYDSDASSDKPSNVAAIGNIR